MNSSDAFFFAVCSFIGFVIQLIFWFWFASRMNSINKNLTDLAEQSRRQTELLTAIASKSARTW